MTTVKATLIFDDVQYLAECGCGWRALFMERDRADAAADDHFNEHGPDQRDYDVTCVWCHDVFPTREAWLSHQEEMR